MASRVYALKCIAAALHLSLGHITLVSPLLQLSGSNVFSSLGGSFTQNAVLADCKAKKVAHSLARHVPPRAAKVGDSVGNASGSCIFP